VIDLCVKDAHKILAENLVFDSGKFYGAASSLNTGVGQIYTGIRYPLYNPENNLYKTVEGSVYVLTHECDLDQKNNRPFNTDVLICPIIDFSEFIKNYGVSLPNDVLTSFLCRLAKREVSRVIYIPQYNHQLKYGGLLYLNQITNTHISSLSMENANRTCSVTAYGLRIIDHAISQHLLRPKSEDLPLRLH